MGWRDCRGTAVAVAPGKTCSAPGKAGYKYFFERPPHHPHKWYSLLEVFDRLQPFLQRYRKKEIKQLKELMIFLPVNVSSSLFNVLKNTTLVCLAKAKLNL